ncbi:hypothetical protein OAD75_03475 [Gammaproteobacteria bacterium]|nr:hypothetical protein [Gammaproteobacteria bacterium]
MPIIKKKKLNTVNFNPFEAEYRKAIAKTIKKGILKKCHANVKPAWPAINDKGVKMVSIAIAISNKNEKLYWGLFSLVILSKILITHA